MSHPKDTAAGRARRACPGVAMTQRQQHLQFRNDPEGSWQGGEPPEQGAREGPQGWAGVPSLTVPTYAGDPRGPPQGGCEGDMGGCTEIEQQEFTRTREC